MQIRVVIFSDEKGWHTRALQKEFRNRAIKTKCVDLADCFLEFKNNTSTIVIPGFGDHLPQLAIVRGIAGGSLEQITKRLAILHLLSAQGVNVVNNALAIEKSIDKGMTSFLLQKNGIPTPQFWVTESFDRAKKIIINRIRSGNKIVVKPLFGSQGQGLNLIESEKNLESYNLLKTNPKGGVFYLQQFVQVKKNLISHDYRVFVVKKTAIAAMKRIGKTWIHNKSLGAKCEKCNLTLNLKKLAEDATRVLGLNIAGVDLIPDSSVVEGFKVIEVNGVPAWRGIQSVNDFNVTMKMVDLLLEKQTGGY